METESATAVPLSDAHRFNSSSSSHVMESGSKGFSDDEMDKIAKRLVASAVAKAVQRVIMEGRLVRELGLILNNGCTACNITLQC